jgi:hypothetical protein
MVVNLLQGRGDTVVLRRASFVITFGSTPDAGEETIAFNEAVWTLCVAG